MQLVFVKFYIRCYHFRME